MESAAVFLPLLGAITAGLFGRFIGDRGAQIVTCACLTLAAIFSMMPNRKQFDRSMPFLAGIENGISQEVAVA